MFGFDSTDPAALVANESSSLLSNLFGLARTRTFAFWTATSDYKALSLMARFSSADYGGVDSTIIGAHRQLPGTMPDNQLTPGQADELERKGVNYYTRILGTNRTLNGTAISGYIDRRVWLDWLVETIQSNVAGYLASSNRVPLTTRGSSELRSVVQGVCEQGVLNGGFAVGQVTEDVAAIIRNRTGNRAFDRYLPNGYLVFVGPQDQADVQTRTAPPIYVFGIYAGGVVSVDIDLVISG